MPIESNNRNMPETKSNSQRILTECLANIAGYSFAHCEQVIDLFTGRRGNVGVLGEQIFVNIEFPDGTGPEQVTTSDPKFCWLSVQKFIQLNEALKKVDPSLPDEEIQRMIERYFNGTES